MQENIQTYYLIPNMLHNHIYNSSLTLIGTFFSGSGEVLDVRQFTEDQDKSYIIIPDASFCTPLHGQNR